ncbi:MAG: thiamine-monophosphate kinase [Verrucomicrobiales bacterium]|nr:thiamine-monophosphate kinase [Verrucomicrobiales bacterium]
MANMTDKTSVGECGEEGLVEKLKNILPQSEGVIVGPGDDCAVVRSGGDLWELLKTDCVVEGIHFSPETDAALVGKKAMNRVLSDFAAMGGLPRYALVTLACDGDREVSQIEGWYQAMAEAAGRFDCSIVGGETTRIPYAGALLSIAMTGVVEPDKCVMRSCAKVGDVIAVTGRLGGSFESGRHLDFLPRISEARWLVENGKPNAMMDLSDGLGSDLPRMAAASGVGYRVDFEALPQHEGVEIGGAISDGEDYELLATFSSDVYAQIGGRWREAFPETELTAIGEITERVETPIDRGWEHYRKS